VKFNGVEVPTSGQKITLSGKDLVVPNNPIIPFIEGDGTGRDIWKASQLVFDAAVEKISKGSRKVVWYEVFAGEKAFDKFGDWLPGDTLAAIQEFRISIKGPLTTPVGGGIRSLNVSLRQLLDLYACVRPVRYFDGVPSPVKHPEKLNVVVYRENTEDVYADAEEPDNYFIEKVIKGTTVQEILAVVQYFPNDLQRRMEQLIQQKVKEGLIRPKIGVQLLDQYSKAFHEYTYLGPDS